ncbi:MAG: histidine phosphatase family protein [Sulfobacillus acidophilus]|uniref:Histidine phosphatase family protein n=1 Tax=Sulfobacillus acidophilus TaxID=53633 RepID=A0A2T2WIM5_9FIRM|nr:MAG: histidine phosphatase family protein [Sulfobacillus acidophilus]
MNNRAGKTLWVMRHGRPDVPLNPLLMTRAEFNDYLHRYDVAGLSQSEADRLTQAYQGYPVPDLVIASDLPRARETAELFGRGAPIIVDPLFREIPVKVPEDASTWFLTRRWPSEMWWSYLRVAWFFNIPPEGYDKSTLRSRQAAQEIVRHQDAVSSLAVVSHSGFLLVTVNQMMRQGLLVGRRLPHIGFGEPTTYRWH